MSKNKHRYTRLKTLVFLLTLLTCLVSAGFIAFAVKTQHKVETVIGPPAASLGLFKKYTLVFQLSEEISQLTTSHPVDAKEIVFIIEPGKTASAISNALFDAGLVSNPSAFTHYLIYTGAESNLRSGTFILSKSMSPIEIGNIIQSSTSASIRFTLLGGWRSEQVGNALAASGIDISGADFAKTVDLLHAEGRLLPDVYIIRRDATTQSIIKAMSDNYNTFVRRESLSAQFSKQGLTLQQGTILASIIQREAILDEEMPTIASVFINRLNSGMKLDADTTVQYAIGFVPNQNSWWKNPLSLDDLKIESPFNTYIHSGLPPAPICNPGKNALKAVASPDKTPYFYFRAACGQTGEHVFSKTFEEHKQKSCP